MKARIRGVPGSPGIAAGRAWVVSGSEPPKRTRRISPEQVESEWSAFNACVEVCEQQLERVSSRVLESVGPAEASIFEAQKMMLLDPAFKRSVRESIARELIGVETAVRQVTDEIAGTLSRLTDPYLAARATDVRDLARRILFTLSGQEPAGLANVPPGSIVVAEDLTPSDSALMDKKNVLGIVLELGGAASHATIIARSLGIPAVVGTKIPVRSIHSGETLAIDGASGEVYVDPSEEELSELASSIDVERYRSVRLWSLRNLPGLTIDNRPIKIAANIHSAKDIPEVLEVGAEAVGLFRTEYLFSGRACPPSEDEQFEVYRSVLGQMNPKPVIIRMLDAGGDKQLPFFGNSLERNPALGLRGIRLLLREQKVLNTQMRALVRAACYGNLGIMFPFVSGVEQLRVAKSCYVRAKEELERDGVHTGSRVDIGAMIEVPSAALMASALARECDFLSIGTNDLIQYTCAADRDSPDVAEHYDPFHPAVLHLVERVIRSGHKAGVWVGVCGEMAQISLAVPVLVGMGVDELSVSSARVLHTKDLVRQLWADALRVTVEHALNLATAVEVKEFLEEQFSGLLGE